MALPGLIDTLLRSYQLEDFFYDCFWSGIKGPWYRNISSAYHRWPELWHNNYCFVQSGGAFTLKKNKHTHVSIISLVSIDYFQNLIFVTCFALRLDTQTGLWQIASGELFPFTLLSDFSIASNVTSSFLLFSSFLKKMISHLRPDIWSFKLVMYLSI